MGKLIVDFNPQPEEIRSASEVIFKEIFEKIDWSGHNVLTGVTSGKRLLITDDLEIVGEALDGCTPKEIGDINLSSKTTRPVLIGGRFPYCANEQPELLKILKKAKNTFVDFFKRNPNESEMRLISALVMMKVKSSIMPKAYFSDTQADTIANGGAFKNGTNLGLFNQLDGFFKQIFASAEVKHIEITENAGNTYAEQVLEPEKAYEYVKKVVMEAPLSLKSETDVEVKVTQSVYDALEVYLSENSNSGACCGLKLTPNVMTGVSNMTLYSKKIKPMPEWDKTIQKYQNDGTKYVKPHRIIYTTNNNLTITTLDKGSMQSLDFFYDRKDKKNYLDFAYHLDAVVVVESKVSAGY